MSTKNLMIAIFVVGLVGRALSADEVDQQIAQVPLGAVAAKAASDSSAEEVTTGGLRGITRNANGLPLAAVKGVVHAVDLASDQAAVSGADGAFALDGLKPGRYQVTAQKEGFAPSSAAPVEITSAQTFNLDLSAGAGIFNAASNGSFFRRLARAYWDDWHPFPVAGPEAPYRGYPAPVSNPPFPFNVWPIGDTVWIGYPNATSYPLTQAIMAANTATGSRRLTYSSTVGPMSA